MLKHILVSLGESSRPDIISICLISDMRNMRTTQDLASTYGNWEKKGVPHSLTWEKLAGAKVFNPFNRTCQLCLPEKYLIMFHPESATLNKRAELYSTCRHRLKSLLGKFKTLKVYFYVMINMPCDI